MYATDCTSENVESSNAFPERDACLKKFLDVNPSLQMILEFVEREAQRIAKERKKAAGQAQVGRGKA